LQKIGGGKHRNRKIVFQIIFMVCCFAIGVIDHSCVVRKNAQTADENRANDSLPALANLSDSTDRDSLDLQNGASDSIFSDSLALEFSDSIHSDSLTSDSLAEVETMQISPNAVTSVVDYFAQDSVEFDIKNKKTLLFESTKLLYEDIELESYYVEIDFSKNELHAEGIADSNEVLQGKPVFKQGDYEFKCRELDYNFTSKKGLIKNVITQEGEGFLHGEIVKKNTDNTNFIWNGKYTTCNLEHPHFEIDFRRAKVIPDDKIVTGLFYLRILNIPTFLGLPFGFFPNSNKRTNGLLMPGWGFDNLYGYYLQGIGYYFAVKEVVDCSIRADVFMQRAFNINIESNYVKRYKYTGRVNLTYKLAYTGEPTTESFQTTNNLLVVWSHQQDRKAHPTNNFSANINFQTTGFNKSTASTNYDQLTRAATTSSVSFTTSFKSKYSLGINANISQNLTTGDLDLDLPQINFNTQPFYPLRRKKTSGKLRWYEEISMQYTAGIKNGLHTTDSILFNNPSEAIRTFNSELNHSIPIKSTIKLFKYISWNNTVSLNEIWQMKAYNKSWEWDTIPGKGIIVSDTVYGNFPTNNISYNSDLSTTLYGMYTMKKGRIYAFRHQFMPSVGFTYKPAINKWLHGYYYDSLAREEIRYSRVSTNPAFNQSASVNIAFNNRLEAKVRKKKKATEENEESDEDEFKKITILESFSISTYYDFMRDSLKLDPIRINGRTLIFKYINLNFNFVFDPYAYGDKLGRRVDVFEWNAYRPESYQYYDDDLGTIIEAVEWLPNRGLSRLSSTAWDISFSLNLNKNFFQSKNKEDVPEIPVYGFKDWNVSVNYSFSYNMMDNLDYYRYMRIDTNLLKYTHTFRNTVNIDGRIPLTDKWALGFRSGYDFTNKQISLSEFTVERDLHCWRMEFRWVPFGDLRRFEFLIQAKANMLQDVKWNPKHEYRE